MAKFDPIYAILDSCEEAKKYFKRSCTIAELQGNEFADSTVDAMESVIDSFEKVVATLPTTEAGLLAKLAFARKFNEDYRTRCSTERTFCRRSSSRLEQLALG
jgi:hypothetical protein